jgi:hypothetical protein
MKRITLLITLTLLSTSLYAQGSVQADRPGFGFGSFITPVGSFGIETGVTTSEFGTNVGELFLRTGITESFEVQLELGSIFFPDGGTNEVSDQFIVLKYNVYSNIDNSVNLSLLNRTRIPLPFSGDDFKDTFTQFFLLGDFSIVENLSVNTNLGYGNFIFSYFDIDSYYFTLNPGYQFSESTSGYIGFSYVENEFFDWKNYEFGVAHLIHSNSQIDLGLIIDEESDPYLTIGFATRF